MLTIAFVSICSPEHDSDFSPKTLATSNPLTATQATHAGPATGTEFMAETSLKPLKAILDTIRERADYALKQLQDAAEQRSMGWKCKACGYIKHFTTPWREEHRAMDLRRRTRRKSSNLSLGRLDLSSCYYLKHLKIDISQTREISCAMF
jgi:hypothetical protein